MNVAYDSQGEEHLIKDKPDLTPELLKRAKEARLAFQASQALRETGNQVSQEAENQASQEARDEGPQEGDVEGENSNDAELDLDLD